MYKMGIRRRCIMSKYVKNNYYIEEKSRYVQKIA